VFFQPIHIWSNFNETGPTAAKRSLVPDPEKMEPIVRECLRLCRSLRLKTSLPLIAPWLKPYFQNQLLADNGLDRRWYTRCVSHFRCKEIFTRIFVQADGGLLPCAMLGPVANVKDRSLADAVTAMDALKRDFRNGRFHPDCYKCSCQMPANYSYSLVCAPYANFARICAYLYDSGRLTEPFRAIFHRKSYRKAIQGSVV
ncbi:MAG: hypothetical protein JW951_08120, partial [Lentisphaerae bacterium]|nr:hypothetical protein [Lentisphaerota bacterium]